MSLKRRIEDGLAGKYKGLANGFNRLNDYIFGVQRAVYTLLGGQSGTFKTTLADFIVLNSILDAEAKSIEYDVFYYSYEIDELSKQCNWLSVIIFNKYGVVIPPEVIKGYGENRLTADQKQLVDSEIPYMEELFKKIHFRFKATNPTGIYNELWNHFANKGKFEYEPYIDKEGKEKQKIKKYIPNNPDSVTLVVLDHLLLLLKERGFSDKEVIDKMSEYAVELRNMFGCSFLFISQFNDGLKKINLYLFVILNNYLYLCYMIGIYKITNLVNNKVYIGSSKDINSRAKKHFNNLKYGIHINKHLQNAYYKYGKDNFKFEIVKEVNVKILRRAEQFYINKHQSLNSKYGYNKTIVESNKWDDFEKIELIKNKIYFGCYNKLGKIVKVFRNIQEVYKFIGKNKSTRIYVACDSNFSKTSNGYYWMRLNPDNHRFPKKIITKERKGRHKEVYQYDLENNFISKYNSAVEAAKKLNLISESITKSLRNNKQYKGYRWYYSPLM